MLGRDRNVDRNSASTMSRSVVHIGKPVFRNIFRRKTASAWNLTMPKSATRKVSSAPTRTLRAARSRCTKRRASRYAMPAATSLATVAATWCGIVGAPSLNASWRRRLWRDPLSQSWHTHTHTHARARTHARTHTQSNSSPKVHTREQCEKWHVKKRTRKITGLVQSKHQRRVERKLARSRKQTKGTEKAQRAWQDLENHFAFLVARHDPDERHDVGVRKLRHQQRLPEKLCAAVLPLVVSLRHLRAAKYRAWHSGVVTVRGSPARMCPVHTKCPTARPSARSAQHQSLVRDQLQDGVKTSATLTATR